MSMIDRREMRVHIFTWVTIFSTLVMIGAYNIGHREGVKSTSIGSYEEKIDSLSVEVAVAKIENDKVNNVLGISMNLLESQSENLDRMSTLLDQCLDLRR